ncbi:MAG: hypothetical protein ABUT39_08230 [Acidobacteriota bacterium]
MRKLSGLIVVLTLLAPLAAVAAPPPATTPLPAELSLALMQQPTPASGQEQEVVSLQVVFQEVSNQQSLQDIGGGGTWVCSRSCTVCGTGPSGYCGPGQGKCVPYCP